MKRTIFWTCWILLPIALIVLHFGPGQNWLGRDRAVGNLKLAQRQASQGDWDSAVVSYTAADQNWPDDAVASQRRGKLGEAIATINSGDLVSGQEQLERLIEEMESDEQADPGLLDAARHDFASSCYYTAWMMRLEGAETDEWMQEAEIARQQFRLLAETGTSPSTLTTAAENLEATIRLEQMDLRTLMARPLPKNCCSNCQSVCQKKRKQMASRCKNGSIKNNEKEETEDAREQIKKDEGAGWNSSQGDGS